MRLPRYLSPRFAAGDLRTFLNARKPHELWFLFGAMLLTFAVVFALDHDATERRYRPPTIIYVEQWPAGRTDAQIIAQQKIDGPKEKAANEAFAKRERDQQAAFKRLDDKLSRIGF